MKIKALICLVALLPTISCAAPYTVVAHVTEIEPSYVPNNLPFAIDQALGVCHPGPWLFFNGNFPGSSGNADNIKVMYAAVTTALTTGNLVEVTGDDNGCVVSSVHMLAHP